jgi:protein NRD1
LGVLYVVDSVTRQWVDQARKIGQLPGSGAPDGTFAAGVTRVTELLPVLMNDIINSAPEDQKVSLATHPDRERHSTLDGDVASPFRKAEKFDVVELLRSFSFPLLHFRMIIQTHVS